MKVRWIAAARQDRADIVDYIAVENPRAALKMDDLFSEAAQRLGKFPMLGRIGKVPGTRELIPHENYRLVYEVDEATDTVWVLALLHTARQWPPACEALKGEGLVSATAPNPWGSSRPADRRQGRQKLSYFSSSLLPALSLSHTRGLTSTSLA